MSEENVDLRTFGAKVAWTVSPYLRALWVVTYLTLDFALFAYIVYAVGHTMFFW